MNLSKQIQKPNIKIITLQEIKLINLQQDNHLKSPGIPTHHRFSEIWAHQEPESAQGIRSNADRIDDDPKIKVSPRRRTWIWIGRWTQNNKRGGEKVITIGEKWSRVCLNQNTSWVKYLLLLSLDFIMRSRKRDEIKDPSTTNAVDNKNRNKKRKRGNLSGPFMSSWWWMGSKQGLLDCVSYVVLIFKVITDTMFQEYPAERLSPTKWRKNMDTNRNRDKYTIPWFFGLLFCLPLFSFLVSHKFGCIQFILGIPFAFQMNWDDILLICNYF